MQCPLCNNRVYVRNLPQKSNSLLAFSLTSLCTKVFLYQGCYTFLPLAYVQLHPPPRQKKNGERGGRVWLHIQLQAIRLHAGKAMHGSSRTHLAAETQSGNILHRVEIRLFSNTHKPFLHCALESTLNETRVSRFGWTNPYK